MENGNQLHIVFKNDFEFEHTGNLSDFTPLTRTAEITLAPSGAEPFVIEAIVTSEQAAEILSAVRAIIEKGSAT